MFSVNEIIKLGQIRTKEFQDLHEDKAYASGETISFITGNASTMASRMIGASENPPTKIIADGKAQPLSMKVLLI
jgi:hypothetical protein